MVEAFGDSFVPNSFCFKLMHLTSHDIGSRTLFIITNNPLSSLFMAAKLKFISKYEYYDEVFVFYEPREYPNNYSGDIEKNESHHCSFTLKVFPKNVHIYILPKIYYNFYSKKDVFLRFLQIRRDQEKSKLKLKDFLFKHQLNKRQNLDIWFCNTRWTDYFRIFFPTARFIKFDHGISDVFSYIEKSNASVLKTSPVDTFWSLVKFLYLLIQRYLYSIPIVFTERFDDHFSVNADFILELNPQAKIKKITRQEFFDLNLSFLQYKVAERFSSSKSALILLDNINPWVNSEVDLVKYFKIFEKFLIEKLSALLKDHGITHLFFKPKHWMDDGARSGVQNFHLLKDDFEVIYFPDHFDNFPAEYFLKILNPCALIGNLSSSLFFSKVLMPQIHTYTYDRWFVHYTLTNFGQTFPDLKIIRNISDEIDKTVLKDLLPVDLGL